MPNFRYYAVLHGRTSNYVYDTWEACQQQVNGYSGQQYRGFNDIIEAQDWLRNGGNGVQQQPAQCVDAARCTPKELQLTSSGPVIKQPRPFGLPSPFKQLCPFDQSSPLTQPNPLTQSGPVIQPGSVTQAGPDLCMVDGIAVCDLNNAFKMEFDGANRGQPGVAAAAAIIYELRGSLWHEIANVTHRFERATSQQVETAALVMGLQIRRLHVFGDCEITVKQTQGLNNIRNESLQALHKIINDLRSTFDEFCIDIVAREDNQHADALAKEAMDRQDGCGLFLHATGKVRAIPNADQTVQMIC